MVLGIGALVLTQHMVLTYGDLALYILALSPYCCVLFDESNHRHRVNMYTSPATTRLLKPLQNNPQALGFFATSNSAKS